MVRLKFVLESLSTTLYPLKTGKALAIADIHGVIVVLSLINTVLHESH